MIVMISGKQGSGKTTTSDELQAVWQRMGLPVVRYRFATPIYEMHNTVYAIGKKYGIEVQGVKDGDLLQYLGTEWGRGKFGEDVWVRAARTSIESIKDYVSPDVDKRYRGIIVLIDDLRFENEFDEFPEAFKVRLECPEHIRKARASYWRENSLHASEVGLDAYAAAGKFDLKLHSDRMTTKEIVDIVNQQAFCPEGVA